MLIKMIYYFYYKEIVLLLMLLTDRNFNIIFFDKKLDDKPIDTNTRDRKKKEICKKSK